MLSGLRSIISLLMLGNQSDLCYGQAGEKHRRRLTIGVAATKLETMKYLLVPNDGCGKDKDLPVDT